MTDVMVPVPTRYLQERIEEKTGYAGYLEQVYSDVRDGLIPWSQINDELTGPDRQQDAADQVAAELDEVRRELTALEEQAKEAAMVRQGGSTE